MLAIIKYIFWIVAIVAFIASGWFLEILKGFGIIIDSVNQFFWVKLTFEFQILLLGLLSVIIFYGIRIFTKD